MLTLLQQAAAGERQPPAPSLRATITLSAMRAHGAGNDATTTTTAK
jgi:hypothetical protein